MNLTELKAKAYDLLAQINFLQNELAKVNDQIRVKSTEEISDGNTTEE